MRVGQNPAKFVGDVAKPQRITVALLNYIPMLSGFFTESLDVLKVCLESIWTNTDLPYDLLVFDNGSCAEVRDYLAEENAKGRIQFLILSEKNLGKGGAWNIILAGAPGEIIAYGDSDVLYHAGWLGESVKILETYPNVGMVTSRPFRTNEAFSTNTVKWAEEDPAAAIERGNIIPWETFLEFDRSLAQSDEEIRRHYENSTDVKITFQGIPAIAGASHWQFVAYKEVVQQFLPFAMDRPMGQVKQLDQRMNEAGLLRLMPTTPYVMNMSNTLRNVTRLGRGIKIQKQKGNQSKFLDFPPLKKGLLWFYDKIFRWYYDR